MSRPNPQRRAEETAAQYFSRRPAIERLTDPVVAAQAGVTVCAFAARDGDDHFIQLLDARGGAGRRLRFEAHQWPTDAEILEEARAACEAWAYGVAKSPDAITGAE